MSQTDTTYGKFTPTERVALMVEAMSRKDYADADRLIETCERKRYEMADARYTEGFRVVAEMAMYARVRLLEIQSAATAALFMVYILAEEKGRKERKQFDRWCEQLRALDAKMRGTWFAWERFCGDASIDADKAFEMGFGAATDWFKLGLAASLLDMDPPEADADAYKKALNVFAGRWETVRMRYY